MASSLKDLIHSLDPRSLPRILHIQSGFYDEDSENLGYECCLSTGDVMKVVGLEVKKILASNGESEDASVYPATVELPLNFPGLYKIVADKKPYANIEEIVRTVSIRPAESQQPCFYCSQDIDAEALTIKQGEKIMFISVEDNGGILTARCGVIRNDQTCAFVLPLSQEGDFYEWEDDKTYTMKEIAEWKIPTGRRRCVIVTDMCNAVDSTPSLLVNLDSSLVLTPIYEIQAVMKFQKDIVHFFSDLDVEVKNVTADYNIKSFLQPLLVEDLLERACDEFPIVVAVTEGSVGSGHSDNLFGPGREIIIYKKCLATRILASEIKSNSCRRHFLIPTSYKGKFKRRPREFPTAYDLEIARSINEKLYVTATKAFESPCEELCSVSVGDQFLIPQRHVSEDVDSGRKEVETTLPCEKIMLLNKTYRSVMLPMCMEGSFVEYIHDKRQYELMEICRDFHFPFNVKVDVTDLSIQEDILASVPCLQLEEEIIDSYFLISSYNNPTEIWEVPVHRFKMSFQFLKDHVDDIGYLPIKSIVEEITEEQYYMMRKYGNQATNPPPRPPKTHTVEESKTPFVTLPVHTSRPRKVGKNSL